MRVTLGGFSWNYWQNWIWMIQYRVQKFGSGADDGSVLMEGEFLDSCCDGSRKKMLPNTSLLRDCSRWTSDILVQPCNSGPMEWCKNSRFWDSLVDKWICKSSACEMKELEVSSMSQSLIGRRPSAGICWVWTNTESIKEWEDPESTRDLRTISGRVSEVRKEWAS